MDSKEYRQLRFHTFSGKVIVQRIAKNGDHNNGVWPHDAYLCYVEDVSRKGNAIEIKQVGAMVILGKELNPEYTDAYESPLYDPHNIQQKPVLCFDGAIRGVAKDTLVLAPAEVKLQKTA